MRKNFIHNNFLLHNPIAVRLFHEVAKYLPVIDYHNHLNPLYLAGNEQFDNITALWVKEDPYKHRAMRINGAPEHQITGQASDKDKFAAWASTVPKTMGNPLFHWACMELSRIFGIDEILTSENADRVWEICNEKLHTDGFRSLDLLKKWNVELLCTSDDLQDDLSVHKKANENQYNIRIRPSLRADSILTVDQPSFYKWVEKVITRTSGDIQKLDDYKDLIIQRLDDFAQNGCCLSDHSLDSGFDFQPADEKTATVLFKKVLERKNLNSNEYLQLKFYLLKFLGQEYGKRNWIMQLHIGAQRYTSSRLRKIAGPAGGYATIGKVCNIDKLCLFLDRLEQKDALPQIILYTLNPADNAAFATLTGSYTEDGIRGKIQIGPAWWYNDHYDGIREQLNILASYGLLSTNIGMTTDSRSILSFSRHDYYRRILCNLIGEWVIQEKMPNDFPLLKELVENILYKNISYLINAKNYDR